MPRHGVSTTIIVGVVVALLLVVGVGYYVLAPAAPGPTTSTTHPPSTSSSSSSSSHSSSSTSSSSTSHTSSSSTSTSSSTTFVGPLVVCSANPVSGAAMVTIEDFFFSPKNITISAGQSVTWTYDPNGNFHHTVTSDTGLFGSGFILPGESFTCTFNAAGTYGYHCTVHPTTMKNNFVVVT